MTMTRTLGTMTAMALLIAVAGPGTAGAASPSGAGIEQAQAGQAQITEVSARDRRRGWRRDHWRGNWRDDDDWWDHPRARWRRGGPYAYAPYYYDDGPSFYVSPYGFGFGFGW